MCEWKDGPLKITMQTCSRVKLLDDPEKIARKRFMAFLSSLMSIVKHTKSRHHSDHQKVFKLDFKKRWPPIKKKIAYISAYQLIIIVLDQFICYNCLYLSIYLYNCNL